MGKALVFLGAAFVILLTLGLYVIYPYQVSFAVNVILRSYLLLPTLAMVILVKGIGRTSS